MKGKLVVLLVSRLGRSRPNREERSEPKFQGSHEVSQVNTWGLSDPLRGNIKRNRGSIVRS